MVKIISTQLIIIILISLIMVMMLNLISKKTFYDREKNSPFECGFDPKNFTRLPFSLHFFLIAIIFIIFDIELTLLLPMIIIKNTSNYWAISLTLTIFSIILIFGVYHEANQGALNWSK
uniref:NADH dehydrogenase subunit 3 n=1 Tax=Dendroctonus rufipennis TaxID=77170 RepID=UPI0020292974|nr:NADH dehydrogenase subunit 3 [Dendroctonus rufipennis]UQK95005.1 NADH dehydrogenase subunit 3 [Dendroctonus rufipennis]